MFKLWTRLANGWRIGKQRRVIYYKPDELQLLEEIRTAHREWITAQNQFDNALDLDQVDYAIYALEAAEKRYSMLLKQAKRSKLNMRESLNRAAGGGLPL